MIAAYVLAGELNRTPICCKFLSDGIAIFGLV